MKLKYTKSATNEHFYLRLRLEKKRVRNSILHFACVNKPKIKPLKRKLKPEQNLRLFVKYRSLNYIKHRRYAQYTEGIETEAKTKQLEQLIITTKQI